MLTLLNQIIIVNLTGGNTQSGSMLSKRNNFMSLVNSCNVHVVYGHNSQISEVSTDENTTCLISSVMLVTNILTFVILIFSVSTNSTNMDTAFDVIRVRYKIYQELGVLMTE